ncbi:hypothetical protein AB0D12_14715 [Streptomyces sp. NPDC048479]|uniref:hypothetical protein n=1 Tax=Streptomyces sp. NPDC048479 TaxID=3154725 RepID=UPI00343EAE49
MTTLRLIAIALLTVAAVPAAALLPADGLRTGAPTVQAPGAPGAPGGYRYCAYSSSTLSTSGSPAGGSCGTAASRPSGDRSRRSHIV